MLGEMMQTRALMMAGRWYITVAVGQATAKSDSLLPSPISP